ncbi:hypothetical protein B6N60_03406 [Richelia sinica FACHB-800]|uniref:Uncharacterized protein n=1 Tax=Richelia sinica FACHB-800 TaxID=1357546 RepID=A0A975T9V8_9NOST|nr:hypothetical protein [Richelia sinica]MBD2663512.1 hypothetical protein [Richelia sinica FACHB-800]QXE24699.1 hypothetical protein B6N60_03406 [Richelia sinica FACHB-800]
MCCEKDGIVSSAQDTQKSSKIQNSGADVRILPTGQDINYLTQHLQHSFQISNTPLFAGSMGVMVSVFSCHLTYDLQKNRPLSSGGASPMARQCISWRCIL